MDYSWLEVAEKSLDSLDGLTAQLRTAAAEENVDDSKLRAVIGEIEEDTSRLSRLLSSERNRWVFSRRAITAEELGLLVVIIDANTRRSLLRRDYDTLKSLADRLSKSTFLWRERLIEPSRQEALSSKETSGNQFRMDQLTPDSRVLLLLGAGASRKLGLPTMAEFWQKISANCRSAEQKDAMDMLLGAAKDETLHVPPDLERVLTMLDRYEGYFHILWEDHYFGLSNSATYRIPVPYQPIWPWRREHPLEQFMRRCGHASGGISGIRKLTTEIMDYYYTRQLLQNDVIGLYPPLLSSLRDRFKGNTVTIFTTNYDTAIEQYCRYSNQDLIDGFSRMGPSLVWNPSEYFRKPDPDRETVRLFKLHGSFTWRRIGDEVVEFGTSPKGMPGEPALIYPTEAKEYPWQQPFKTAYMCLDQFLKAAELVIAIGYSFRDRGIAYAIDEAKSVNPKLRFIVVCGEKAGEETLRRFPYGSSVIELDFEPGESGRSPKYLGRLIQIIDESMSSG